MSIHTKLQQQNFWFSYNTIKNFFFIVYLYTHPYYFRRYVLLKKRLKLSVMDLRKKLTIKNTLLSTLTVKIRSRRIGKTKLRPMRIVAVTRVWDNAKLPNSKTYFTGQNGLVPYFNRIELFVSNKTNFTDSMHFYNSVYANYRASNSSFIKKPILSSLININYIRGLFIFNTCALLNFYKKFYLLNTIITNVNALTYLNRLLINNKDISTNTAQRSRNIINPLTNNTLYL